MNIIYEDDNYTIVSFRWSKEKGICYDCGLPAAYEIDIYGPKTNPALLCAICTAWNASYNQAIPRPLFPDEDE